MVALLNLGKRELIKRPLSDYLRDLRLSTFYDIIASMPYELGKLRWGFSIIGSLGFPEAFDVIHRFNFEFVVFRETFLNLTINVFQLVKFNLK